MKRFLLFIPSIAIISSCASPLGAASSPPNLDVCFSAEADITYSGGECTAQIKRIDKGNWEFCLTAPYALEGLVISIKDEKTTLSMYDMESIADINESAVTTAKLISDAFEAAAAAEASTLSENNGNLTLSGQSAGCTYTLSFDEEKKPASIALGGRNVTAEITKFVQLERDDTEAEVIE